MKSNGSRSSGTFKHKVPSKGKDEMNLVEFPLAVLSDRVPAGQKTLRFQDRGWDKSRGGHVDRRVTVLACEQYGLPTALDEDVVLGLLQLTWQAGFGNRRVYFSRYRLIQQLGWRDEGKSYRRLEKSLMRWLGVTVSYDNAWWDKRERVRRTESFHLLDRVVLYHRHGNGGGGCSKQTDLPLSSVTWNEMVFRSFQAGFVKSLDMDLYRALRRPAAKRMYRFLDKRFHHRECWTFDLRSFACEHVGLGRNCDNGQLKRRLRPGIEELEAAGYLRPMADGERYRRVGRAEWLVSFSRAEPAKRRTRKPRTTTANRPRAISTLRRKGGPTGSRLIEPNRNEQPGGSEAEAQVAKYLAGLSEEKLHELEARALREAPANLREGYVRCEKAGHRDTFGQYRQMILRAHVLRTLGMGG